MLCLGLCLLYPLVAQASEAVPANVQAVMFSKIVGYDKGLAGRKLEELNVGVAYETDKAAAEVLAQAFRAAGFRAAALDLASVPKHLKRIDLLYLGTAEVAQKLEPVVVGSGALRISGVAALAESGAVSVALGLEADGKPKIFVNLKELGRDSHTLSSGLLALARIIK